MNEHAEEVAINKDGRFNPFGLSVLFTLLYFIQGISEPTEGLIAQPTNSLLKTWGHSTEEIARFGALLGMPWAIKPLYGLLSDFVPMWGYHRKSYLVLTSGVSAAMLGILYAVGLVSLNASLLFALLLPATIGVAFADVVVDALMVEKGQPHGLTGRFQSLQWGAIWGATIISAALGGYLSDSSQQGLAFLICSGMTLAAFALAVSVVSDRKVTSARTDIAESLRSLKGALSSSTILYVAAFLFCWNFNPFSLTVLYVYTTRELHFSEQFYGNMHALEAAAAMVGSLLYGVYCRRVPMRILVHATIALGVLATLGYYAMTDERSALVVLMVAGFATATATLIQLDLAAQVCPPRVAGTLFALMMSLSNLGTSLSRWFGGWCYDLWWPTIGPTAAFQRLVIVGAAFTAACWLIVPLVNRSLRHRVTATE